VELVPDDVFAVVQVGAHVVQVAVHHGDRVGRRAVGRLLDAAAVALQADIPPAALVLVDRLDEVSVRLGGIAEVQVPGLRG